MPGNQSSSPLFLAMNPSRLVAMNTEHMIVMKHLSFFAA
jgi:hypothetical protein